MFPPQSERSKELCRRVAEFMEAHVYPAEGVYKRQVDESKDRCDEHGRRPASGSAHSRRADCLRSFLRLDQSLSRSLT